MPGFARAGSVNGSKRSGRVLTGTLDLDATWIHENGPGPLNCPGVARLCEAYPDKFEFVVGGCQGACSLARNLARDLAHTALRVCELGYGNHTQLAHCRYAKAAHDEDGTRKTTY